MKMQADDNTYTGIELDESVPHESDEQDESVSFEGDEQDESVSFEGNELDESASFEGNELDEETPLSGSELTDDASREEGGLEELLGADPVEAEVATEPEEKEAETQTSVPGSRKKMLVTAAAGLCSLALGAAMYGIFFTTKEPAAPAATPPAIAIPEISSQDFEDFVIPFHRENNHYISLSISLESADRVVLNELKNKKEILRGRIYDLLKAHAELAAGHPSLAAAKEMVADSINTWLSAGRVDGVYITRFVIK